MTAGQAGQDRHIAGDDGELRCARCGRAVQLNRDSYEILERMHYVCFHYEFEHYGDPDQECDAPDCPSALFTLETPGPGK